MKFILHGIIIMYGIKSEEALAHFGLQGGGGSVTTAPPEFDNCIPLHETLQLSWRVDTDNSQVRFRLCGCQSLDAGSVRKVAFIRI